MKYLWLVALLMAGPTCAQRTVFEKSGGKASATYAETIAYYARLAADYPRLRLLTYGATDAGAPLHLAVLSEDTATPATAHESGRVVLMINNGIHPGEPDGIDACQMLARDLLRPDALPDNVVVIIVPVYNVGGALNRNRYSRANQNGPLAYGFRGNARNLDLNRDFVKADASNTRTFQEIFQAWRPDVYAETHVTNGADYQYTLTYLETQPDKLGDPLGHYLRHELSPALEARMRDVRQEIVPYVNHFKPGPVDEIVQFLDAPRYSSGYAALFGTPSYIIETHMLKPYAARVRATQQFLEALLAEVSADATQIMRLRREFFTRVRQQPVFPLDWQNDRDASRPLNFRGYAARTEPSAVSGLPRLRYDQQAPQTTQIPFYNRYVPRQQVRRPAGYLIPQAWTEVIEHLRRNGLTLRQLSADTAVEAEVLYVTDYQTVSQPYEGHYLHYGTTMRADTQTVAVRAGDYLLRLDQPENRFAVETLEPTAPDSFFNWNFFDSILQQKEHFSAYVFEDIAARLVAEDPALAEALATRRAADPDFAADARAQLTFVYERSPYYEPTYRRYPVLRLRR